MRNAVVKQIFSVDDGAANVGERIVAVGHTFQRHRHLIVEEHSQSIVLNHRQCHFHACHATSHSRHAVGISDGFAQSGSDGDVGIEHRQFAVDEFAEAVEHRQHAHDGGSGDNNATHRHYRYDVDSAMRLF